MKKPIIFLFLIAVFFQAPLVTLAGQNIAGLGFEYPHSSFSVLRKNTEEALIPDYEKSSLKVEQDALRLTGRFRLITVDHNDGTVSQRYQLQQQDGTVTELSLPNPNGYNYYQLSGRQVIVTVDMNKAADQFQSQVVKVNNIDLTDQAFSRTGSTDQVLDVAFVGCKFSDIPGLAIVNGLAGNNQWTSDRIQAWVDDIEVGMKTYLHNELFAEAGLKCDGFVSNWKDIGPKSSYNANGGFNLGAMESDCLAVHPDINPTNFDVVVMFFNDELGANYGGGGRVWMSKYSDPNIIHHEIQHAVSLPESRLRSLLHSNMANFKLKPVSLEYANAYSIMYGNGEYRGLELNSKFGVIASPLTTANRWMANILPEESVCNVPVGKSIFDLRAWGETGSACLVLTIAQLDGKIITVELQPTLSQTQAIKLDFLEGVPPSYLVGVRYPKPIDPNATDWAIIFDPSTHEKGWVKEEILFNQGQTLRVGDAVLSFGAKNVQVRRLSGSLQVNISPTKAVAAGAKWMFRREDGTWSPWMNSGKTVSRILVGPRPIQFKAIQGWTKPLNRRVMIQERKTTTVGGIYKK